MDIFLKYLLYLHVICGINAWNIDTEFFNWIWPQRKDAGKEIGSETPLISIPFESKTDDEKFLEEATKFTDIIKSSALDTCHHKVVLKIKTSCSSMTEEELAKMSVNLLNCQSAVDGRQSFACADSMTLKECTEKMDATMWNAYHMMNNRARAVCLSVRRSQFQALSEMTINKLMSAAHDQIKKMSSVAESQNRLERLTLGTINLIEKGNIELLEQQDQLKLHQKGMHDFISHNLHELVKEKALIATGHKELMKMTQNVKEKMDESNKQLSMQLEETIRHHKHLLTDIEAIQELTREIFQRIDASTDKLLLQHTEAAVKYQEAVKNLIKINETVHYLLHLVDATRTEIDSKFLLIQNFLNVTGIEIGKISVIASHTGYLLLGMLFASFLNLSTLSRIALTLIVLVNLFVSYIERKDLILGYSQMTTVLISTIFCIAVVSRFMSPVKSHSSIQYHKNNISKKEIGTYRFGGWNGFHRFQNFFEKLISTFLGYVIKWRPNKTEKYEENLCDKNYMYDENYISDSFTENRGEDYEFYNPSAGRSEVSSQSLVREWLENKVSTPPSASSKSSNSQKFCSAICLSSRKRCRNVSSRGSEYCFKHRKGY